mgnify:CR=1 FL=1
MILGGGPNRIGQGIEFDYCCVQAVFGLKDQGYKVIMINCNPETVSTDFDLVDRLLSLFKGKTLTSIGPHWAGIKWACEKNNVKFDDENGDIAYIARPNGRDGLLRKVPFDDFEFVIIDEAYGDFCDESYIQYDHTNSIVLKTFSKS